MLPNIRSTPQFKFEDLSMEDIEFYERISGTITSSHALPWDLPVDEFFKIVVRALKFFWNWSMTATEEQQYYLPSEEIIKFPKGIGHSVPLPFNIQDVFGFKPVGGVFNLRMASFAKMNLLHTQTYNYVSGSMHNNNFRDGYKHQPASMSNIVLQLYEFAQYEELFGKVVSGSFNNNSSMLTIKSKIDFPGLVISVFERLPVELLYDDLDFEDYVTACVEEQLGRIVTAFDFPLIGDVKINYDDIKENGKERKREIEEEIKESNNNDFVFFRK